MISDKKKFMIGFSDSSSSASKPKKNVEASGSKLTPVLLRMPTKSRSINSPIRLYQKIKELQVI